MGKISRTGWIINITVDLARNVSWRGKDGEETRVDREAVRSFIKDNYIQLSKGMPEDGDDLQADETVYRVQLVQSPNGCYRFVGPDYWQIRRERASRAERARREKTAKSERGQIRKETYSVPRPVKTRSTANRL